MKTQKRLFGDWGEAQARSFLIEKGYEIVAQNYQTRQGEIDIIAWHEKQHHGRTLCFVEVKTRSTDDGSAQRATGHAKVQRMMKAAKKYCIENAIHIDTTPIQFEQVSIVIKNKMPQVRHDVIVVG